MKPKLEILQEQKRFSLKKPEDPHRVIVVFPEWLYQEIKQMAWADRRSVNLWLNMRMEEYVKMIQEENEEE